MKVWTLQRYTFTALLQEFTVLDDSNGTLAYHDVGDVKIEFATDPGAPAVMIDSPVPLKRQAILANIRNRHGVPIMSNTTYTITAINPIISVLGDVERYRMRAKVNVYGDFETPEVG